jgi:hypothetical protein
VITFLKVVSSTVIKIMGLKTITLTIIHTIRTSIRKMEEDTIAEEVVAFNQEVVTGITAVVSEADIIAVEVEVEARILKATEAEEEAAGTEVQFGGLDLESGQEVLTRKRQRRLERKWSRMQPSK